jgi:hypothetical protein
MVPGMIRRLTSAGAALLLCSIVAACTVTLPARTPSGAATSSGQVHARVVEGAGGARLVIVPVYISERGPYDFALDTGAARSIVDTRLVSELRLPTSGTEQAVTGVGGSSEAVRVSVETWRVDAIELPSATILSLRLPGGSPRLQGLLGSDMLSRFHAVTIDYEGQTVTLT